MHAGERACLHIVSLPQRTHAMFLERGNWYEEWARGKRPIPGDTEIESGSPVRRANSGLR